VGATFKYQIVQKKRNQIKSKPSIFTGCLNLLFTPCTTILILYIKSKHILSKGRLQYDIMQSFGEQT